MKTYALTLAAAILALTPAAAVPQQTPPPALNQANASPSLAVTMQFIQDKMNAIGKISFVEFMHDTTKGNDWTDTGTYEFTNFTADPNQCRIVYHGKYTRNGAIVFDSDGLLSLRDVQDVVVEPYEQSQNAINASGGIPNIVVSSINPPLTALLVRFRMTFPFTDRNLADRVAKAMVHAVALCGGGNKDPF